MSVEVKAPAPLDYRRLRAPAQHRKSLQEPSLEDSKLHPLSASQIESIQKTIRSENFDFAAQTLVARQELIQKAIDYSSAYRNVSSGTPANRIVLSGHQPALFHPGVWFKNFCLHHLGARLKATPVNLIVDTDLCQNAWIKAPVEGNSNTNVPAKIQTLALDTPMPARPYESRLIQDKELFRSFASRAEQHIRSIVPEPLVQQLWKYVDPQLHKKRLGHTLAAARHALEGQFGLQTLEVPISTLAKSGSFSLFFLEVAERIEDFHNAYNQNLFRYRQVHKIRSRSHPVPELSRQADWWEAPFWIWSQNSPHRKPVFIKNLTKEIEISDRGKLNFRFPKSNFVEHWQHLSSQGVAVRPRALTTTLYSRLMLSDLFLHGIGGAKYDQLTDAIAEQFFNVQLPDFSTLTATLKLPTSAPDISKTDLTQLKSQRRELLYHPENHIQNWTEELKNAADLKKKWLQSALPKKHRRPRHDGIENANATLRKAINSQIREIENETKHSRALVRDAQILRSREYSFCLFPESLIDDLHSLSTP